MTVYGHTSLFVCGLVWELVPVMFDSKYYKLYICMCIWNIYIILQGKFISLHLRHLLLSVLIHHQLDFLTMIVSLWGINMTNCTSADSRSKLYCESKCLWFLTLWCTLHCMPSCLKENRKLTSFIFSQNAFYLKENQRIKWL